MHGAFQLGHRAISHLDQRQPTRTATPLPTIVITSSTLTVDVGLCCGSTHPPYVGRTTPTQTAGPDIPAAPSGPVRAAGIVAITIGVAIFVFSGVCLFFAYRRRAAKHRRAASMCPGANGYRVVAHRPDTPPSQPVSPTSISSLSSQALLDLGFHAEDGIIVSSQQPGQSQQQARDRRSVDTVVALRFYGHEHNRQPGGPVIVELPATPPRRPAPTPAPVPVPAPPPTPPPSTSPRPKTRASSQRKPAPNRIVYLNPAGEPWVSVPPPAIPLPAPPTPRPNPSRTSRDRTRPTFSLFPAPPKPPPTKPAKPKLQIPRPPQSPPRSPPQTHNPPQPVQRNFSRPSAIAVLPPSTSLPAAAAGPPSAPPSAARPSATPSPNPPSRDGSAVELGLDLGPDLNLTLHFPGASPPLQAASPSPHFPPPPDQPGASPTPRSGERKSLPSRLWGWGFGAGSGAAAGSGEGAGMGLGFGRGWRSPGGRSS